ncbi:branched-chain amino acid transporter permease [Campylobacter troglodytis]|uniref:branched-chain amino acid transporter permease n=1 Tax=Campylobacter troglodytis TaxID=654363 RepID=UPI001158DF25|nr:AzlD domain-containing protein [Campylobacter troglodytis]TQR60242.1 branched-chain amino acid ABC transporter [Campylobacter troglodytis]
MSELGLYVLMGFLATFTPRIAPYLLFRKERQGKNLSFIQKNMPLLIMVVLVFYTLFGLDFSTVRGGFSGLLACFLVLLMQLLFKNALLSIFLGTCFYMFLLRFFV